MRSDRQRDGKRDGTGFADRWSRLKREAKAEPEVQEADAAQLPAEAEMEAPEDDQRSDEEIIEELGLPDPDTLKTGDDFRAFMAKAVPARIRNRALRKLWISNPVLANLDELLDYGEDFTDAATVVENLQTAYQVGKGFVDRVTALPEGEAENDTDADTEKDTGADAREGDGEPSSKHADASNESAMDEGDAGDTAELNDPEPTPIPTDEWTTAEQKTPVRQRMRFRTVED